MRAAIVTVTLVFAALLAGCGDHAREESRNVAAILSPDGSQIAFARKFHYYFDKASVFDPGGWRETAYHATSIYIMDRSARKLAKLVEAGEDQYYYDRYYSPVNISWESNLIAYSFQYTVHIVNSDGSGKRSVDFSREKYGPPIPFTLSGDAQRLFYLGRHPWEYDREGLYSIKPDGTGKSFVLDLGHLEFYSIQDMIWDSSQDCILMIERSYGNEEPVVWQINPDGKGLKRSELGLSEYRRRRLGGWESNPPFSELEELTRGITHAEWDVPSPDEF